MHDAAGYGSVDILQYLVETGGVDLVHATGIYGHTPLHCACIKGHRRGPQARAILACAQYLESLGADLEAKTDDGKTARDLAQENDETKVVEWLDERSRGARNGWRAASGRA